MSEPVLDINDANLSLWQGTEVALRSPGYALLDGKNYRFGEAARDQARLHPRQINHRFWAQLDTEPLTPAFGPGRHSADLVHAHLLAIHEEAGRPESVIIAAPGSLQHDQLALLLGIVEQCPFNVAGLVDRAVAATSRAPVADYNWHAELQLNQALLTGMRLEAGQLIRDNMVPVPGSGWLALQECLVKAIADTFIRQTRFDPRRAAHSEQTLYDELPGLLQRLQDAGEANLDIEGRQARVERSTLTDACQSHYERIVRTVTAAEARVFLGTTLQGLPGLQAQLPDAVLCAPESVSAGVAQHREAILADASGVRFITSLPADAAPQAVPEPEPELKKSPEQNDPGRCQIEIEGSRVRIGPLSGPAPSLNGRPLTTRTDLGDGDLIEFEDGSAWRLVAEHKTAEDGT